MKCCFIGRMILQILERVISERDEELVCGLKFVFFRNNCVLETDRHFEEMWDI